MLPNSTVTIQPGLTEGVVQFTPNANCGEKEIRITIATGSEDVFISRAGVNAQITSTPKIIYVSASEGDDSNDGFSESTPLKTLARVSELGQITRDHILFKTNEVFDGRLVISGSGAVDNPIVISSCGTGEQPVLKGSIADDGKGSFLETILIVNQSHIEIADLHITNPRSTSSIGVPDEHAYGVFLLNDGAGIMENFVFRNLTVTDVFSVSDINLASFDAIQVTGIFAKTTDNNPGSVKYMENILV